MNKLNPYIGFDGKCRQAMNFYRDCFGGELNLLTVGDSPMKCDDAVKDSAIMHASLSHESFTLMGTDMKPESPSATNCSISIAIDCSSEEEITRFFNTLSDGGSVFCPLGPAFWGGLFGVTHDKYGVSWMLNYVQA